MASAEGTKFRHNLQIPYAAGDYVRAFPDASMRLSCTFNFSSPNPTASSYRPNLSERYLHGTENDTSLRSASAESAPWCENFVLELKTELLCHLLGGDRNRQKCRGLEQMREKSLWRLAFSCTRSSTMEDIRTNLWPSAAWSAFGPGGSEFN